MLLRESAAAKDLGRSEVEGDCGVIAESVEGEARPATAKGLPGPAGEVVEEEKGFALPKGFIVDVPAEGFAPNRLSPMCATGLGFVSTSGAFFSLVL